MYSMYVCVLLINNICKQCKAEKTMQGLIESGVVRLRHAIRRAPWDEGLAHQG